MDGVLIDSEPLWRRAEIACFAEVGVSLTEQDCYETQGLRIDEAVGYWMERRPWRGATIDEVAQAVVGKMIELIRLEGTPMPGAIEALEAGRDRGWRLALASSSSMRLIETVLEAFAIRDRFEALRSAEDETHGKPHPAVYAATIEALGLEPIDTVAVEDSANGLASALAAGMRCIAMPPAENAADPRFLDATWRVASLHEVARMLDTPGAIETARSADAAEA